MKPDIAIWRYELIASAPPNAKAEGLAHRGALVMVDGGVGCIHPWPALGDAPLDDQIASLVSGRPTPLAARTLACARDDARAREEGFSLFEGLRVPESHDTVAGSRTGLRDGFRCAKIKVGRALAREAAQVGGFSAGRLRLDFNGVLTREAFERWWMALSPVTRSRVEFVEDPFPFDPGEWEASSGRCGVPFALDRWEGGGGGARVPAVGFRRVIKPAVTPFPPPGGAGSAPVITSYMDHPVGQVYAAWVAARAAAADREIAGGIHGLCTHHLFQAGPFTEALTVEEGRLRPPDGTGLGFDDLLRRLPWKKV